MQKTRQNKRGSPHTNTKEPSKLPWGDIKDIENQEKSRNFFTP